VAATLTQAVEGVDRQQITLFPECLEDWTCEDNLVRVIDVFVGGLDLPELHFGRLIPRRPAGLTQGSKKELPFSVLHRAGKSPPRPPLLSSVASTNR
jgi:hypothetical protein